MQHLTNKQPLLCARLRGTAGQGAAGTELIIYAEQDTQSKNKLEQGLPAVTEVVKGGEKGWPQRLGEGVTWKESKKRGT